MANKTIKLAAVAASVFAALTANSAMAATFTADASETISVEGTASSNGANVELSSSAALAVTSAAGYADNDIVTFTLNGANFVNPNNYRLMAETGAGNSVAVPSTRLAGNPANVIAFRLASGTITTGVKFALNASTTAGSGVNPTVNVQNIASGGLVTLDYKVTSGFGQAIDSATTHTLFSGVREFYSSVDRTSNNKTINLENNRLTFTGSGTVATNGSATFDITEVNPTNANVTLNDQDKLELTVTGDMTGVSSIAIGKKGFTISGNTATISIDGDDAIASTTAGVITTNFTINGTTALTARSYTLGAVLNLDDENNATLNNGTAFGTWSVNSLNAIVSSMSLNTSGFVSWLKVVNESNVTGQLTAVATWTETNGSTVTSGQTARVNLKSIPGQGVTTVSEAEILAAIGKSSAEGVLDVSLNLQIDAPDEEVHIVAEKKASNGRLNTPVYYNNTSRQFTQ